MKLQNIKGKEKTLRPITKRKNRWAAEGDHQTDRRSTAPPGGAGHIHPYSPSNAPQAATKTTTLLPPPASSGQIQFVKSGWGSRPTCQWLQLDQGTARARGHHTEVAEGPLDTFQDVLSGWGLHWNYLWYQPPRMNKLHTHLGTTRRLSLLPADSGQGHSIGSRHSPVLGVWRASHPTSIPCRGTMSGRTPPLPHLDPDSQDWPHQCVPVSELLGSSPQK